MKPLLSITVVLIVASRLWVLAAPARRAPRTRTIEISATRTIRVDRGKLNMAQLIGDARVRDGGLIITAPQINVLFDKKSSGVHEIRAFGGPVRIEHNQSLVGINPEQPVVAICKEAVYVEARGEIVLSGPVTMTGKGKPDSKVLGFDGTTDKVIIELKGEGAVFSFEGKSEFKILVPDDELPKTSSGEKKDK